MGRNKTCNLEQTVAKGAGNLEQHSTAQPNEGIIGENGLETFGIRSSQNIDSYVEMPLVEFVNTAFELH